jgi:hypothetical protein
VTASIASKKKERPAGLILRLRAMGKVLEESLLHPGKTSRIIMDTEKSTIRVERNGSQLKPD